MFGCVEANLLGQWPMKGAFAKRGLSGLLLLVLFDGRVKSSFGNIVQTNQEVWIAKGQVANSCALGCCFHGFGSAFGRSPRRPTSEWLVCFTHLFRCTLLFLLGGFHWNGHARKGMSFATFPVTGSLANGAKRGCLVSKQEMEPQTGRLPQNILCRLPKGMLDTLKNNTR